MEDKSIYTQEGDKIKWCEKNPIAYVDQTTLLFGQTKTGKTTIVEEILYLVKDYIPNYIVIAPTTSQEVYAKKFPKKCIKEDLSKELLQKIWKRQEDITKVYLTANDPDILFEIFKKINDPKATFLVNEYIRKADNIKRNIENDTSLDYGQKKSQISNIEDKKKKEILTILKRMIRIHKPNINVNTLEPLEKIALEYLDINPRLMLIVDDCTEKLEKWMKMFLLCNYLQILFQQEHCLVLQNQWL